MFATYKYRLLPREAALSEGSKYYFTGKPCPQGHISERRVTTRSCRECEIEKAAHLKDKYVADTSRIRRYYLRQKTKNPISFLIKGAKRRAIKKGVPFALQSHEIQIPEFCPCCKRKIITISIKGAARPDSPSLDRLIPSLGYTKDNCRVICWRCNNVKSDATPEELRMVADWSEREVGALSMPGVTGMGAETSGNRSVTLRVFVSKTEAVAG